MRILLSHGYFLSEDPVEQEIMKPYPPLGLLYLSAYLKQQGYPVEVFDSTFSSFSSFERRIREEPPEVVGLSANLMTRRRVVEMVRLCRSAGSWVVVGGPEPANYPQEYLDEGAHVVVMGEGEETLDELVQYRLEADSLRLDQIKGIIFRDTAGRIVQTPPRPLLRAIDELPAPDRASIDLRRYVEVWRAHHGRGSVSLVTSRGCPFTCTWCSHGVFGFTHRIRAPEQVADEVEELVREYQPDMLWYADDVFTLNRRWFFSYASELKRRRLLIPFETISREDRLDAEVIEELASIGCSRLWIGAESGSQRILDAMKRRTRADRVIEMVRLLQQNSIEAGLFIMLGYRGEEREDVDLTLRFLKNAQPDRFLTTVAYPIKGTPFFEEVRQDIEQKGPWSEKTDRDLAIKGRYPDRFYRSAIRWIQSEMELDEELRKRERDGVRLARAFLASRLARLMMSVPWNRSKS